MDNNYEPFGPEWKKEMAKFPKAQLIDMLGNALKKNQEFSDEALEDFADAVGTEVRESIDGE